MNELLQSINLKDMAQPWSITRFGYDTQDDQASITDPKGNTWGLHSEGE
jgi:YD repeat-containing protein